MSEIVICHLFNVCSHQNSEADLVNPTKKLQGFFLCLTVTDGELFDLFTAHHE